MKSAIFCAAALGLASQSAAFAAEAPYIDDRSEAAALIRSLYSAISRQEYARAWDYFGEEKPAADFAAFVKGYENTREVRIVTGNVSSEGAAGSTYFSIPVAIVAYDKDGKDQAFPAAIRFGRSIHRCRIRRSGH